MSFSTKQIILLFLANLAIIILGGLMAWGAIWYILGHITKAGG